MATTPFGWAVVGPGRIANRFGEAVQRLPGMDLVAIQGRDATRARAYADRWSPGQDVGIHQDFDGLLDDKRVHGVYIATPHAFHAQAARACLAAGKPVLCEKPLTVNETLAKELIELSRKHRVFLMEALWTRFLPIYSMVGQWLAAGAIGRIRSLQSNFSFSVPFDPGDRCFDAAQAGGAVLDIGIYPLSITQWCLQQSNGTRPILEKIHATGVLAPTGVDQRFTASLEFSDDVVSQVMCGFDGPGENSLRVFGDTGVITLAPRFWEATRATLQSKDGKVISEERAFAINGFEGQLLEAIDCIARGEIESQVVSHADTLQVVEWMDTIRSQLGVVYPFE